MNQDGADDDLDFQSDDMFSDEEEQDTEAPQTNNLMKNMMAQYMKKTIKKLQEDEDLEIKALGDGRDPVKDDPYLKYGTGI